MADLFARLAERAQGQAARMAPRLPARFETPVLSDDVDESTVDGSVQAEPPGRIAPLLERLVVTLPERAEASSPPALPRPEVVMPRVDAPLVSIPAPAPAPAREPTGRPALPSHKPPAAAVDRIRPVPPQAPRPAPERSPSIAARAAAQSAVHISIGRIEVRAVSPAPVAPAPLPAPASVASPAPQDKGLTLAAYLRGDDGRPR